MSGQFKVSKITNLEDVREGEIFQESDFCSTTPSGKFIQMEYSSIEKSRPKLNISPGLYTIVESMEGVDLEKTAFSKSAILKNFCHSETITNKINKVFSRLHIYKKHGIEVPMRNFLLYGPPGSGKSTAITNVCNQYISNNDTVIVLWPTAKFRAHHVKPLIKSLEFVDGANKMILVMEDLGGFEIDGEDFPSDSELLSLLDNVEKTFSMPTIILATTNHPQNFLGNLMNRPQRFDEKIEMHHPSPEEREKLLQFFSEKANVPINDQDRNLIKSKDYHEFTPAHIKEALIRSDLEDISIEESLKILLKEIQLFKKQFDSKKNLSLGF